MRHINKQFLSLAFGLGLMFWFIHAQTPSWELRVCADPNSLPFSHEVETGFENRIAKILAEELGAELSYDWSPQNPDMVNFRLREGECDLIMGIPDGYAGLLTTLAYYRSPYVFIYRTDSSLDIDSLDDPVLSDLRIGVQNVGIPPHEALRNRGMSGNVVREYGNRRLNDSMTSLFADLVNEEIDVALVWGPVAGYYSTRQPVAMEVVPVTPEIEPPFLNMIVSMTIGVRMGDVALRDRLNFALAARWEEIREVLEEYGVPLAPLPQPALSIGDR